MRAKRDSSLANSALLILRMNHLRKLLEDMRAFRRPSLTPAPAAHSTKIGHAGDSCISRREEQTLNVTYQEQAINENLPKAPDSDIECGSKHHY